MSQLREQFHSQHGITWVNGQGEPNIEYVNWLEAKIEKLTAHNKQSTPCKHPHIAMDNPVVGAKSCISCGEQV